MPRRERGLTVIELMLTLALMGTLAAMAVPAWSSGLDDFRARSAARHLAQQLARARVEAVTRSTFVALRFTPDGDDYQFAFFLDGNGNGVRSADIAAGVDTPIGTPDRLGWHFRGTRFGIAPGMPDADNQPVTSPDGVRVGTSHILSMNPNGTCSAGTLYIVSMGAQYALRVLGVTGRTRLLKYDPAGRQWIEQ
jgi:prepilin-type N-terminal cleavage/methylation domain-containing protein